ncbi:uncharacterized protein LOC127252529 [Andrographis paniculata]|uniref:uncharacterized protein LOC127252529 n=1 Tax=Andrographis paniculata TaxID=175694 RepID=UPI0021E942CE|nr:uncharacterized protein LOC127252529 [Andrographis paniculata]
MAKVLQRVSSSRHRVGCSWSLFDFRHDRSTRGRLTQQAASGTTSSSRSSVSSEICVDDGEDDNEMPVAAAADLIILPEDCSNVGSENIDNRINQAIDSCPAFDSSEENIKTSNKDCLSSTKIVVLKRRKERNKRSVAKSSFYAIKKKISRAMKTPKFCAEEKYSDPVKVAKEFNIYVEAKRHLSEMLNDVDEKSESMIIQTSISLGRILSLPEYIISPGVENHAIGNSRDSGEHLIPSKLDNEVECLRGTLRQSLVATDPKSSTALEIEEENEITPEDKENENENTAAGESLSDSSRIASSTLAPARKIGDSEYAIDGSDRLSPVSVLEPLFEEDDQGTCATVYSNDDKQESSFNYIKSVILSSGFNRNDFLLRWVSFCDILDPALLDEVELLSPHLPQHGRKLLFDLIHEALQDLCEEYFRSFWAPARLDGDDLIHEVWGRVKSRLFQSPQSPKLDSPDHLMMNDDYSGESMNVKAELELVCLEMEEAVLDELVQDSLFDYTEEGKL